MTEEQFGIAWREAALGEGKVGRVPQTTGQNPREAATVQRRVKVAELRRQNMSVRDIAAQMLTTADTIKSDISVAKREGWL